MSQENYEFYGDDVIWVLLKEYCTAHFFRGWSLLSQGMNYWKEQFIFPISFQQKNARMNVDAPWWWMWKRIFLLSFIYYQNKGSWFSGASLKVSGWDTISPFEFIASFALLAGQVRSKSQAIRWLVVANAVNLLLWGGTWFNTISSAKLQGFSRRTRFEDTSPFDDLKCQLKAGGAVPSWVDGQTVIRKKNRGQWRRHSWGAFTIDGITLVFSRKTEVGQGVEGIAGLVDVFARTLVILPGAALMGLPGVELMKIDFGVCSCFIAKAGKEGLGLVVELDE